MKTSLRAVACAVLLAGLTAAALAANAADGVVLRFHPEKDAEYRQRFTSTQTTKMTMGTTMTMAQTMVMVYKFRVADIDDEGVTTMETTYESIKMKDQTPMGTYSFDTETAGSSTHPLAGAFKAMAGGTMTMKIRPDGAVSEVTGADALLEKALAGLDSVSPMQRQMIADQFKQQFSAGNIKSGMEQFMRIYPDEPVTQGASWSDSTVLDQGLPMELDSTYTLKSHESGKVLIEVAGGIKTDPEKAKLPMGPVQAACDMEGDQSGTMEIDPETGIVLSSKRIMKMSGSMRPEGLPGGMSIPVSIESAVELETLD